LIEYRNQSIRFYRLDEVMVKSRFPSTRPVGILPPTCQRDEHGVACPGLMGNLTRHGVSVEPRHVDVEDGDFWSEVLCSLQCCNAIVRYTRFVTQGAK
jgi:hypothetical protein